MVEQRSQSAGDDTGCELVVRVEQRDGPVAGWLRSVCPLALVEQGDSGPSVMSAGKEAAPAWKASLSTAVSSGPS